MSDLPTLLTASLRPETRKQAEQALEALSRQSGFLASLLRLVLESSDRAVKLSGSVYLKNIAKSRWEEDEPPLSEVDKAQLRAELVPAMLALSAPSDKAVRIQIAEAISLIAELDFPSKWPNLIDQLVSSLSPTDYNVNLGVLETGHSIFRQWRAHVRSDELFSEINLVFDRFMTPFLQLFQQTATFLTTPPQKDYALLAQCMVLLVEIFYDFTCHDLPPAIEDTHDQFFSPGKGWFHVFLAWDPVELRGDPDDTTPSLPSQLKTVILETVDLFLKLFPDQLQNSDSIQGFVQEVWTLVGSNKLPNISDDALVSQSLRFISSTIRSGYYKTLFESREVISSLVEGVVVPNVALREHDVEQFEDDPLEFVRLDLSLSATGVDLSTRRHAAADLLQALVSSGYEAQATEIVGNWIGTGLQEYRSNKEANWRAKDSAIFLLAAVATRGSTTKQGVTSTNALIDIIKFFSENVFEDLQAAAVPHPILQVDAIRFLLTFRNQLTKEQLLSVLPLLVRHLGADNYVTYTYAAITIDRILFIKQSGRLLFAQADVHDFAHDLLNALLSKIEAAKTPEKVAENDHLMRCIMRVIITARQTLTPHYETVLTRLVNILGVVSKNPSNPLFDQYIFESISALMRFIVGGSPATLSNFEATLFGPFTYILQQDIDQYIPYVFQILAQMLELHTSDVPSEYRSLLPFLLTPAVWLQKGSVPGLVKLLKAFVARDATQMAAQGQLASVLAVIQQRLIPSKANDMWGFELLYSIVRHTPIDNLKQYFKPVVMTLLTRMHQTKTDQFVYLFSYFILYTMALNDGGLPADYVITTMEEIQVGLWAQVLSNFVLPQAPKMPPKDRKVAVVGLTKLLTQSSLMLQPPAVQTWPLGLTVLVQLFSEPQYLSKKDTSSSEADVALTEIDYEEQTAGYQAAYSRLASSETVPVDPVQYVQDPQVFVGTELGKLANQNKPAFQSLVSTADGKVAPFIQGLSATGYI
ncbi:importin-alpha export receptor [Pleurotus ostreatus]|uniref:Importin-alpha export receptor n=1 Tax=Pleurotus ostreatus TaxID=5322 RepID=A0A8H6ZKS4_PLEOS|nr:importin-alpha export receptor [Pleurotus ostreatus]KAF7419339.1 importin-alpha export receptor [Pleurotus ostreatus]